MAPELDQRSPDLATVVVSTLPAGRFDFDGALVIRDQASGRIWLLQDAAAEACRSLDEAEATAVLSAIHGDTVAPKVMMGQPWLPHHPFPKLDRCLADGAGVLRLRVWDDRLAAILEQMLSPLVVNAAPGSTLDLFVDGERTAIARDGHVVQEDRGIGWWGLIRSLARMLYPSRVWLGVLHAATVLSPGGAAIALVGISGSGKTTLAGGLIASGASLLSDDATAIEAGSHLAWPCPLAMGVKQGSWPLFTSLFPDFATVPVVRFGSRAIRYFPAPRMVRDEGHPLKALLFPTWRAGASLRAQRVRPSEALRLLAESGMMPPEDDLHVAELLDWLESLPTWRLDYSDLDEAVSFVRQLGEGDASLA